MVIIHCLDCFCLCMELATKESALFELAISQLPLFEHFLVASKEVCKKRNLFLYENLRKPADV